MSAELLLDPHDRQNAGLRKLERYLTDRLAELREHNDHECEPLHTANTRGAIAEVKTLLDLVTKPAP